VRREKVLVHLWVKVPPGNWVRSTRRSSQVSSRSHTFMCHGAALKMLCIITGSGVVHRPVGNSLQIYADRFSGHSAAHKRLIIVASTAPMAAPIARWHLHGFLHKRAFGVNATAAERLSYLFFLLLIARLCAVSVGSCECHKWTKRAFRLPCR